MLPPMIALLRPAGIARLDGITAVRPVLTRVSTIGVPGEMGALFTVPSCWRWYLWLFWRRELIVWKIVGAAPHPKGFQITSHAVPDVNLAVYGLRRSWWSGRVVPCEDRPCREVAVLR